MALVDDTSYEVPMESPLCDVLWSDPPDCNIGEVSIAHIPTLQYELASDQDLSIDRVFSSILASARIVEHTVEGNDKSCKVPLNNALDDFDCALFGHVLTWHFQHDSDQDLSVDWISSSVLASAQFVEHAIAANDSDTREQLQANAAHDEDIDLSLHANAANSRDTGTSLHEDIDLSLHANAATDRDNSTSLHANAATDADNGISVHANAANSGDTGT